jgi:hypothetical protein
MFEQVLTIGFDDDERRLIAAGRICDQSMVLSLLTPQGIEIVRLRVRGRAIMIERDRGLAKRIPPEAILADFQLVHWPPAALRSAWGEAWRLVERKRERHVSYRDRRVATVRYADTPWSGTAKLSDRDWDYTLSIRTRRYRRTEEGDGASQCPSGTDETSAR